MDVYNLSGEGSSYYFSGGQCRETPDTLVHRNTVQMNLLFVSIIVELGRLYLELKLWGGGGAF